jgi:phage baseplate assembly protein W
MPLLGTAGSIDGTKLKSEVLMSRNDGTSIPDYEHLENCIVDILTTPLGSRVMRRSYGSNLFFLIDKPLNPETVLEFYTATVIALQKWEPRIIVRNVSFDATQLAQGRLFLTLEGYYVLRENVIRMRDLTLDFFKDGRQKYNSTVNVQ